MDQSAIVALISSLDPTARVSSGEDNGRYINIDFNPTDAALLWREISDYLQRKPELARAAIVACEGRQGCNDYLLLHHYDRTLVLDKF